MSEGLLDAFDVDAAEVAQLWDGTMLNEGVGQSEALHGNAHAVVGEPFEDR